METGTTFSDIRKYIDVRLEEAKLKAAKGLSAIVSQIAAFLIIAVLVIIAICFLVIVEMQCLNECLGQPFGTLIAAGTLLVLILVLFLLRKHLFAGILCKGIAGALGMETENVRKDLAAVSRSRQLLEQKLGDGQENIIDKTVSVAAIVISVIRKLCR